MYVYACVCACMCVYVCVCVFVCMCGDLYKCMQSCVLMVCLLVSSQLTMVEMSLFKAVDLYEMTVHLWEGNTPSKTYYTHD